jgi:hypothetical protein
VAKGYLIVTTPYCGYLKNLAIAAMISGESSGTLG